MTPTNGVHVRVIQTPAGAFMPQFTTDNLTWRDLLKGPSFHAESARMVAESFANISNQIPEQGAVVEVG